MIKIVLMIYLFNHYTIRYSLLHPLNYSKLKKVVFWEHFLRFSAIFLLKTSMWNITHYSLNTLFTIKIISSNKLYWMYYSSWSLTFMVPLPIFSVQGGQYFQHTLYMINSSIKIFVILTYPSMYVFNYLQICFCFHKHRYTAVMENFGISMNWSQYIHYTTIYMRDIQNGL